MKRSVTGKSTRNEKLKNARGFSLLELIIVMAIIAIVSTFAVLGINRSRNSVRLQNSARLFSSYAEKARMDAIRRHDGTKIDITGPTTYTVTMDSSGTGTVSERTFTLETGVVFTDSTNTTYTVDASGNVNSSNGEAVSFADFNWRGRTSECSMFFRMKNSNNQQSTVQVAGSGDITIDTGVATTAALTTTAVSTTTDVTSSAVINGGTQHFQLTPCGIAGGAGGGGGGAPPPPATCVGGSIGVDKSSYNVRRNGGSTATILVTVTGPGTITAIPNSNLSITPAIRSVASATGGTYSFTVASITKTRASNPPFTVVFTNPCNSVTAYVIVTN